MCVCVCVLFVDLFKDDLTCLFSPHQVNHGGVQKPSPQVSLYKSHTTEESPPHQRVCVVGHLLDLYVGLRLGFPFERGRVEIHRRCTNTQEFVQIATMPDYSILVIHFSLSTLDAKTFKVHWKKPEGIVFPGWGEVLVVTEREHFCVGVQLTRNKIESLPVLNQFCDPPILQVLPNIFAYWLDTGMGWWHGTNIIRQSSLSLRVWGPRSDCNPYCICQFPNRINYLPQTLLCQQLVDNTMVLSTVCWWGFW